MRRRLLAAGLMLCLLLTGCWDRTEMDDLAFVVLLGLDQAEPPDQLLVSMQVVRPGALRPGRSGGGQEQAWEVISAAGESVTHAQRRLLHRSARYPLLSHAAGVVVGEELARAGIAPIVTMLMRHMEFRTNQDVFVTPGRALDLLLGADMPVERVPGLFLRENHKWMPLAGQGVRTNLREVAATLGLPGQDPLLPRVHLVKRQEDGGAARIMSTAGMGVFRGERLVGWLEDPDAPGARMLYGQPFAGVITFPDPLQPRVPVGIRVIRARVALSAERRGGRVGILVQSHVEGDLDGQFSRADLTTPSGLAALERALAEQVTEEMRLALEQTRRLGADPFGLGALIHRRFPAYWRTVAPHWPEVLPTVPVRFQVRAKVRHAGLLWQPVQRE